MRAAILAVIAALPLAARSAAAPSLPDPFPGIAAAYAMSIDGRLAWAANPDLRRPPASLAKLLTGLVLLEDAGWNPAAPVTVSASAAAIEGSRIGLRRGEVLRAEDLLTTRKAETLVVRAVAPLSKLCTWFQPLQHAFDQMLVIKGPGWVEERHEAAQKRLLKKWQLRKLEEWPLPGTESNSVLLQLKASKGGGRAEADEE